MRNHGGGWLLCAALVGLPLPAVAGCRAGSPQGRFIGSARLEARDPVPLELELRCEEGQYRGALIAAGERLLLRFGSFDLGELHLSFSGAARPTLEAHLVKNRLEGSFRRAPAAGPMTLVEVPGAGSPAAASAARPSTPPPAGSESASPVGGELEVEVATPGSTAARPRAADAVAGRSSAGRSPIDAELAAEMALPTLQLTADQWREDLRFFAAELPRRFPARERPKVEARVAEAISGLQRRLAWTNGDQVYLALERLASELSGPTALEHAADEAQLPIELREIDGAFRVVAATEGNERALGARLVAIDGVPLARVERRLLPFAGGRPLATLLVRGLFLHGAGVVKARGAVRYTLSDAEGKFTLPLHALAPEESPVWRSVASSVPLFRQRPDEPFWCEELPELSVLYCRLREHQVLSEGAAAMRRLLDTRRPEVLVMDLRLDRAPDAMPAVRELVDPVRARRWLNRSGQLFVLIGRETSAGGAALAARFRALTAAKLVGEACSVRAAALDTGTLVLPRSRLVFRYPAGHPGRGAVLRLRPQVQVRPRWADIVAGRDPVLDWVLRHARHR